MSIRRRFTLLLLAMGFMLSSIAGVRDILHETKETAKDATLHMTDLVKPKIRKEKPHRRYRRIHSPKQRHHIIQPDVTKN